MVYEDLLSRTVVVMGSPDGGKPAGLALFDAPVFGSCPPERDLEGYLMWEIAPRRVIWTATLEPETEAWTDSMALQSTPEAFSEPMAMASSIPPPPDGGSNTNNTGGASSSNTIATLVFTVDADFGSPVAEIFQKTNLVAGAANWSVLAEGVVVTGGTQRAWTDMASSNIVNRFYILNDPSKDFDSDGLNDGLEQFVTRSDGADADSDDGTIPDGYEYAQGMDPNDSLDETAGAIAAYLAVAGDPDGDLSPDWLEGINGTNPHDRFD